MPRRPPWPSKRWEHCQAPSSQQTQLFDYRYDDTDTLMNEFDEFYPYNEMAHVAENANRFAGSFDGGELRSKACQADSQIGQPPLSRRGGGMLRPSSSTSRARSTRSVEPHKGVCSISSKVCQLC